MRVVPGMSRAVTGSGVELRYGERVALAASDFEVPAGRVTAVIGPNGSGKSTLLAAIAGLHAVAAGRLEVLGRSPSLARKRVALVLQANKVNQLLPVSVREVVMIGRYGDLGLWRRPGRRDREAVASALDRLALGPLAGRHLHEISGGERQRVFIAQALVQDHDLLAMDEPLTALDLVSTAVISEVIAQERGAGRTVVVTTHDLSEAEAADHVVLLAGRVVGSGPPAEVLSTERLSEAYGIEIVEVGGRAMLDDAAHRTAHPRHVHVDRGDSTHHGR